MCPRIEFKTRFHSHEKVKKRRDDFCFPPRLSRERDGFLLSREKRLAFALSPCSYFPTQTPQEGRKERMSSSSSHERLHRTAEQHHQHNPKKRGPSNSNGKTLIAFTFGFFLSFLLFHADVFNHRQSIVNRWRGISNDLVLEREHCRQVLAEHKDALSSVHEEIESWKEKHEEASGALREKHDMLTHASNLLEEKHLELEHKTTQLEVMKEALSEADVDGHKSGSGGGSSGEEEEEDDAISEEEPTEQPSGRSSRGKHSSKNRKRGGHNGSKKSVSSKPHGGEEHGEDDLDSDHEGTHEEADDTATEEEPAHEEVE